MTQLGDSLSDERRRQGKSLVDVEAATRIRARLLESLEHGDYDQLPAPAYVKGYIQSYAKYLDIPAQPLLEMYKVDMRFVDEREERERERGPMMPRGAHYSKASRQNLDDLPAEPVVTGRDQQHAFPLRTWLVAAGAILAVFLVLWGVSALMSQSSTPPPVPRSSVQETTTVEPPATVASTPVTPVEPVSEPTVSPASDSTTAGVKPFKLTFHVTAGETSHLKVVVDGTTVFDDSVGNGASLPSPDVYQEAVITLGDSSWITTLKDGVRYPTPNKKSDYTFTLKNTNASQ